MGLAFNEYFVIRIVCVLYIHGFMGSRNWIMHLCLGKILTRKLSKKLAHWQLHLGSFEEDIVFV